MDQFWDFESKTWQNVQNKKAPYILETYIETLSFGNIICIWKHELNIGNIGYLEGIDENWIFLRFITFIGEQYSVKYRA